MSLRVDLERLKKAAKEIQALHSEARKYRRRYGEMMMKIQELSNTISGLAAHYGFIVDLTPVGRDVDATAPGKGMPIRSDEDVDLLVESGLGSDDPTKKVDLTAELPRAKQHWTPKKED